MPWVAGYVNYWLIGLLLLVGLYGLSAANNLMRKLMAMNIVQVAIIAFFLNLGQKVGSTVPILIPNEANIDAYANPLPHTLMLTAIVVGLATTGVGLALLTNIYRRYGSLEEDQVLRGMGK